VTGPAIRVVLVDDQQLMRAGLGALLERAEDITVVGEAADGAAGVALVLAERPDVVLMDIRLPGGMDGTEAGGVIWEQYGVPVVYVTAYGDAETLARVTATAPYGYVLKPFDPAQVHVALQLALDRRAKELPSV
jgi:DNA-binding NarL/FixJ family response regulator